MGLEQDPDHAISSSPPVTRGTKPARATSPSSVGSGRPVPRLPAPRPLLPGSQPVPEGFQGHAGIAEVLPVVVPQGRDPRRVRTSFTEAVVIQATLEAGLRLLLCHLVGFLFGDAEQDRKRDGSESSPRRRRWLAVARPDYGRPARRATARRAGGNGSSTRPPPIVVTGL